MTHDSTLGVNSYTNRHKITAQGTLPCFNMQSLVSVTDYHNPTSFIIFSRSACSYIRRIAYSATMRRFLERARRWGSRKRTEKNVNWNTQRSKHALREYVPTHPHARHMYTTPCTLMPEPTHDQSHLRQRRAAKLNCEVLSLIFLQIPVVVFFRFFGNERPLRRPLANRHVPLGKQHPRVCRASDRSKNVL